jgi:hypothetical protein
MAPSNWDKPFWSSAEMMLERFEVAALLVAGFARLANWFRAGGALPYGAAGGAP